MDTVNTQPSAFSVELTDVTSPYTLVRALMARAPLPLADVLQRCAQPTAWPIKLPLLTCQAVGGDPRQAVVVAAAFELARLAARVLDDVEDQDRDDALWRQVGVPQATNAGSALLACAYLALSDLATLGADPGLIVELQQDFGHVALTMAAAQHLDLTTWEDLLTSGASVGDGGRGRQTADHGCAANVLDRYWEIAAGKSGAFFALGCRAGARLAASPAAAQPYSDFGHHLGLLLQIFNDGRGLLSEALQHGLGDVLGLSLVLSPVEVKGSSKGSLEGLSRGQGGVRDLGRRLTLAVAYTLAVCPEVRQPLLKALDSGSADQAVAIMVRAGAVHYLLAVAETHRTEASVVLEQAPGDPVAHPALLDLLPEILPAAEAE